MDLLRKTTKIFTIIDVKEKNCFIWAKNTKTKNCQKIASCKYMFFTCKLHVIHGSYQILNRFFEHLNIHMHNQTCDLGHLYV